MQSNKHSTTHSNPKPAHAPSKGGQEPHHKHNPNASAQAGVCEARPGIIESSHIDPLDGISDPVEEWNHATHSNMKK